MRDPQTPGTNTITGPSWEQGCDLGTCSAREVSVPGFPSQFSKALRVARVLLGHMINQSHEMFFSSAVKTFSYTKNLFFWRGALLSLGVRRATTIRRAGDV